MKKHLSIWYMGEISSEKCDALIQENNSQISDKASMGIDGNEFNEIHRNTAIKFLPFDHEFSTQMFEFAYTANQECKWDYQINHREAVQFARYGVNQHYNWHTDTFPLSGSDTDRKLTIVVLLNDPSEFEGGDFQVRLYNDYTAPLKKGSMIAFPSILEHRVVPVTSGIRYSATMWLSGPRFR